MCGHAAVMSNLSECVIWECNYTVSIESVFWQVCKYSSLVLHWHIHVFHKNKWKCDCEICSWIHFLPDDATEWIHIAQDRLVKTAILVILESILHNSNIVTHKGLTEQENTTKVAIFTKNSGNNWNKVCKTVTAKVIWNLTRQFGQPVFVV